MKKIFKILMLLTVSVNSFCQVFSGGGSGGATSVYYSQCQLIEKWQTPFVNQGDVIAMNGQLKSGLTVAQQLVATACGFGTTIQDMTGRTTVGPGTGFTALSLSGASSVIIPQNTLPNLTFNATPNLTFTPSGSVATSVTAKFHSATGGGFNGGWLQLTDRAGFFQSSPSELTVSASFTGSAATLPNYTTSSINGGVTQQSLSILNSNVAVPKYVYLGPAQPVVTVAQALSVTTTGTGAVTFNNVTGTLNAPTNITIGDAKSGFQTADHNGWVLMNGRAITTLTTTQQAALLTLPAALSLGGNLVNAAGRVFVQATIGALVGNNLLVLTNLPNVSLTTAAGGNHTHQYLAANGSPSLGVGGGSRLAGEISINQNTGTTTGTGAHTHTTALNGGVPQTSYTPAGVGVNHFIYLGL
jgi:hypothetical protein